MRAITILALAAAAVLATSPAGAASIQDPAESKAYAAALDTQDPARRAAALEQFVKLYPRSAAREEALEHAMGGYQQAGQEAALLAAAQQILAIDPDNARAEGVVVLFDRVAAVASPGDQTKLDALARDAGAGLKALPALKQRDGEGAPEFELIKARLGAIFYGAEGYLALERKDFAAARRYYAAALAPDPDDLQNAYQLAVADLAFEPVEVQGFWWAAKAYVVAGAQNNAKAQAAIGAYATQQYRRYHGGLDGWDLLVASIGPDGRQPPAGFLVKRGPTPAELAVQAVAENDIADLSFSDWEFILSWRDASPENRAAADKVWAHIVALQKNGAALLKLPAKVVASTSTSLDVAVSDDNKAANVADTHVVLAAPMARPPAPGTAIDVLGVLTAYAPKPFRFTLEKGAVAP
jgi:tetratricopeptide (TPR) repeat protein